MMCPDGDGLASHGLLSKVREKAIKSSKDADEREQKGKKRKGN
jgi:hypothetical protein